MPIDLVIFDCDGTLVDSEPLLIEAIIDVARPSGLPSAIEETLWALKGRRMSEILQIAAATCTHRLPADTEDRVRRRLEVLCQHRLRPIPGAEATLRGLRQPFCVASNGPRAKMRMTLSAAGLLPLVEGRLFSAYEVGHFKPDPGLFLHAARTMNVTPERCLVVEDSEPGVRAALTAGMHVTVLRSPQALPMDIVDRVAFISHLDELVVSP